MRHAPGAARRVRASPLAAERDELTVAAVAAAQAQEAVGQHAALQESVGALAREVAEAEALRVLKSLGS
jgi:hypothetical protein